MNSFLAELITTLPLSAGAYGEFNIQKELIKSLKEIFID